MSSLALKKVKKYINSTIISTKNVNEFLNELTKTYHIIIKEINFASISNTITFYLLNNDTYTFILYLNKDTSINKYRIINKNSRNSTDFDIIEIKKAVSLNELQKFENNKNVSDKKQLKLDKSEQDISSVVISMISNSKNYNYISKELNIEKYKVFLIHEKYCNKYSGEATKEKIQELNRMGLSFDEIGKFFKITKAQVRQIGQTKIQNSKSISTKGKSKSTSSKLDGPFMNEKSIKNFSRHVRFLQKGHGTQKEINQMYKYIDTYNKKLDKQKA